MNEKDWIILRLNLDGLRYVLLRRGQFSPTVILHWSAATKLFLKNT